jgi:hypothetical protein
MNNLEIVLTGHWSQRKPIRSIVQLFVWATRFRVALYHVTMSSTRREKLSQGFFFRHWLAVLVKTFIIVVTIVQQRELRSLERRLEALEGDGGVSSLEPVDQSLQESPRHPVAGSPPRRDTTPEWSTCRGRIDDDVLREVVGTHGVELQRCYESQLASRPGLLGGVLLEMVVLEDGSIAELLALTLSDSTGPALHVSARTARRSSRGPVSNFFYFPGFCSI